jgi:hypothetical protein
MAFPVSDIEVPKLYIASNPQFLCFVASQELELDKTRTKREHVTIRTREKTIVAVPIMAWLE